MFVAKCTKCGNTFEFPSDVTLHGMRLLLSKKAHLPAVVICDEDQAFNDIWLLVKKCLYNRELLDSQVAREFNKVFGELCDLAPDNSQYDMSGKVYCSTCGSECDYAPTDSPVFTELNVEHVSHRSWDNLTEAQKLASIKGLCPYE